MTNVSNPNYYILNVGIINSTNTCLRMLAKDTESHFGDIIWYDQQIAEDAKNSRVIDIRELKDTRKSTSKDNINVDKPLETKKVKMFENKKTQRDIVTTKVSVVDADSFDVAKNLLDQGYSRPLVLNMASDYKPGGGWRKGSMAQEESLFYRSTYDLSLNERQGYCNITYPLKWYQMIFSPGVFVFKDNHYKLLDWKDCYKVDCLAVPAIRNPKLVRGHLNEVNRKTMKTKIDGIFQFARDSGYQHLVLGALGTGCFRNPPEDIAELFKEALRDCEMQTVTFAVLSTISTRNFKVFSKILIDQID